MAVRNLTIDELRAVQDSRPTVSVRYANTILGYGQNRGNVYHQVILGNLEAVVIQPENIVQITTKSLIDLYDRRNAGE